MPGWSSTFPNGKGDGEIYVIGGGNEGMSANNPAMIQEEMAARCGFLNSNEVIA